MDAGWKLDLVEVVREVTRTHVGAGTHLALMAAIEPLMVVVERTRHRDLGEAVREVALTPTS